jgi:hypothetical protein
MARYQKPKILWQELNELAQQETDFIENLAKSLLQIQNSAFIQMPKLLDCDIIKENEK